MLKTVSESVREHAETLREMYAMLMNYCAVEKRQTDFGDVDFGAERSRYDELLAGLKRATTRIDPPPTAVWVEGSVARGVDQPGDAVIACVLGNPRDIDHIAEALREAIQSLERKLDVTIEVRGRTLADLEATSSALGNELQHAIPIFGIPPMGLLNALPWRLGATQHPRARRPRCALARAGQKDRRAFGARSLSHRARAYTKSGSVEESLGKRTQGTGGMEANP